MIAVTVTVYPVRAGGPIRGHMVTGFRAERDALSRAIASRAPNTIEALPLELRNRASDLRFHVVDDTGSNQ